MSRSIISLLLTIGVFFAIRGQPAADSLNWDPSLPKKLTDSLDLYQTDDDLYYWLFTCNEFAVEHPIAGSSFLLKARKKIWRPVQNEEERSELFHLLIVEGYCTRKAGDILRSIHSYEEAYRMHLDKPVMDADLLEDIFKPLGNNYTRLGDYDRALFIQEKGLTEAQKQNNNVQAASFYSNLAITATGKEDLELARRYSEAGLGIVKKDTALYGLLLSELADVLFRSGRSAEAEIKMREAIHVMQEYRSEGENTPYWLYSACLTQGELLAAKGDYPGALRSFEEGKKVIETDIKDQLPREKGKLLVGSGLVFLKMHQPEKAIVQFNKALSALLPGFRDSADHVLPGAGELYGENTLVDALHGKADCLGAMNRKEEALTCYLLLFVIERKLRHAFFSESAKQQQQRDNRRWVESAIETAYGLWKATGKKEYADKILLIAEMSKSQLLLDEMMSNFQYNRARNKDSLLEKQMQTMQVIALYEREAALDTGKSQQLRVLKKELEYELSLIEKEVKEKYPLLGGYRMDQALPSTDSLLQNIPDGTTVIEFFTGDKNIYIIRAEKGNVQHVKKLDEADSVKRGIRDFVNTYFQQGAEKMMNDPKSYYLDAHMVYRQVWDSVAGSDKKGHYMIIPDGIIGYLPFDALITDPVYRSNIEQWPFLVRGNNLFFSYSLQTWQQQQRAVRPNRATAGFFVSFDSSQQVSLPAVRKEMTAMRKEISGKYFIEEEASLKSFENYLDKVNLLHISTHSFLQGEQHIPVLQLSDEKFFLFELYGRSFQPQLVVLSACRTGHGMLAEGEGIISLARGFTATGAGGIVAGLWNMNDETIADLMGKFYHYLSGEKRPPSEALYTAKKEWLSESHEQAFKKLPYFWAGVIYVGDDQPVALMAKDKVLPLLSLAGIGLVLITTLYFVWRLWRI